MLSDRSKTRLDHILCQKHYKGSPPLDLHCCPIELNDCSMGTRFCQSAENRNSQARGGLQAWWRNLRKPGCRGHDLSPHKEKTTKATPKEPPELNITGSNRLTNLSCGNCVFPFIFKNRIHNTCSTIDGDPSPWCSTEVDKDGYHIQGNWEYCSSNCPGVVKPVMYVHSGNEPGNCYCGLANSMNMVRIVGGKETEIGEYPWQVALLTSRNVRDQICGGSLISDRHIITAAHCTYQKNASSVFVAIGDTNLAVTNEITSFIVGVKTITEHPDYDYWGNTNDITILALIEPIPLTKFANIKPICLPTQGTTYDDKQATVSGWGTVSFGGPSVTHLHEVTVKIFADGNCGSLNNIMGHDMICAGFMAGGKDSCQGDSGGPMFLPDQHNNKAQTLAGLVSWGFDCGQPNNLGVYTEVSHFSNWIKRQISSGNTCPTQGPVTTTSTPNQVQCGGHFASTCSLCPEENGALWCNGECQWDQDSSTCFMSSNPRTTVTTGTTTSECWEMNKIPRIRAIQIITMITSVKHCQDLCQEEPGCEYFTWRRSREVCRFLNIQYVDKNGTYSGPKNCQPV